MKPTPTSPDQVCAQYAAKNVKVTIRPLDDDEETLLIEGDRQALEFLGRLLLAQAASGDCGFQLAPDGAGKTFFSNRSSRGIYIHRVPCGHENKSSKKNSTRGQGGKRAEQTRLPTKA